MHRLTTVIAANHKTELDRLSKELKERKPGRGALYYYHKAIKAIRNDLPEETILEYKRLAKQWNSEALPADKQQE
jgi:hypothetical protein